MPSSESTPLLRKKSTTFGPSSGRPASMRQLSPPACTSTPSPWPTSIKLTEREPEGGGPGPPREPPVSNSSSVQAGANRISNNDASSKAPRSGLRGALLLASHPHQTVDPSAFYACVTCSSTGWVG